jgi:hypothetical protein
VRRADVDRDGQHLALVHGREPASLTSDSVSSHTPSSPRCPRRSGVTAPSVVDTATPYLRISWVGRRSSGRSVLWRLQVVRLSVDLVTAMLDHCEVLGRMFTFDYSAPRLRGVSRGS